MKNNIEAQIRNSLTKDLSVLEPGLLYVEKEKYVPHSLGTRGFIDILARDHAGKWVLVELKRSAASSREAIHEVLKYVEAFKEHMSVREDEIRVIIASTEWRELLVPFSSFASRVSINVIGILINTDAEYQPTSIELVTPIPVRSDRLFAPWHELNLYEDSESMAKGLASYSQSCQKKGITDYVIVEMTPHPTHRSRELLAMAAAHKSLVEQGMSQPEELQKFLSLPEYRHLLYFAPLVLDAKDYVDAISRAGTKQDLEEIEEYLRYSEGDELLCSLHEKLYDLNPPVHRDHFEIGYPAKFGCKLIDDEQWNIDRIHRNGSIAANSILDDSIIIRELRGEDGSTRQKYKKRVNVKDRSEVAALRTEVANCLCENPSLSHLLRFCIEEAISDPRTELLETSIFNPSCITLSIFKAATDENGFLYIPTSAVYTQNSSGDVLQAYFVVMDPSGEDPSAQKLVDHLYDGDPQGILLNLTWGGYDSRDAEACELIGLEYSAYKLNLPDRTPTRLVNFKWRPSTFESPLQGFLNFMIRNEEFVEDIVRLYEEHWNGFMVRWERDKPFKFHT